MNEDWVVRWFEFGDTYRRNGIQLGLLPDDRTNVQPARTTESLRLHARSPFDALTTFAYSGQALAPLVKALGFGMTPINRISDYCKPLRRSIGVQ